MRKLIAFIQVSLDGYFVDADGSMSWAHRGDDDAEWNAFVAGNARSGGVLVFGRITYELMASYWPTPMARENAPDVAAGMNALPKIVFSRTLNAAPWHNTTLLKGELTAEIRALKNAPGNDLVILGSGSLVAQLAQAGLVDEFQLVVNPIALGSGRTPFEGIDSLSLQLVTSRTFGNDNVLLCYVPAVRSNAH